MYDPAKECENVIKKLKKMCKEKDISYYALAKKAGISTSTIYSIMNGKNTPQIFTLLKICNVLEISIHYLIDDSMEYKDRIIISEDEEKLLNLYKRLPDEKKSWIRVYAEMVQQYNIEDLG